MRTSPDKALQGAGDRKEAGRRREEGGKRVERGWKEGGKRVERGWKEGGKRVERRGPSRLAVTFLRPKASLREDETRVRPAVKATSLFLFGFLPQVALPAPAREPPDGLIFTRPPPRRLPRDEGELRSAAYDRIFVRSEKGARPRDEAPLPPSGPPLDTHIQTQQSTTPP